jgi:putative transcriptional regulator
MLLSLSAESVADGRASEFLIGRLLVATPKLSDSFFGKTVIYMVEHNDDGAFGLIVNRPLGSVGVKDLFERMGLDALDAEGVVAAGIGGPVEPGAAFVLHLEKEKVPESHSIGSGLAISTDPEILRRIGRGEGPTQYVFVFGYAGWAPGQLEDEIRRGSWIDVPAEKELIFEKNDAIKWEKAYGRYGLDL